MKAQRNVHRRPVARRGPTTAVFTLAILAGACVGPRSPGEERARKAESDADIVIAAAWPWEAHTELLYASGLEMAVDEINGAGGILGRPLRLRKVDDRQSVNEGRMVAQRLAEDPEIMAVIGHLQSYVTIPASAIYDLAGLVLVAPAATGAELTSKGYARVFRPTLTDRGTGSQMADFAMKEGYERVAIYYVRNEYGRALANAFEERSYGSTLTVVTRHSYDPNQDLTERILEPVLREWRHMDLDAVFLAGEVPLAGRLIAAVRAAGIDVPILGSDAMSSPALITEGGNAVEGTVVASFFSEEEPRPEVQRFAADFRGRYGQDPDVAAALGYDAVHLVAAAMEQAGTPAPAAVAQALHGLRGWTGVTGPVAFDEHGDLVGRKAVRLVVRDGRFRYLPPPELEARSAGGGE